MKKAIKVFRVADSVHRATDGRLELFYQVVSSSSARGEGSEDGMQPKAVKARNVRAHNGRQPEKKVHAHG